MAARDRRRARRRDARSLDDVIYRDELKRLVNADDRLDAILTLMRSQPDGWRGYARRVDRDLLADAVFAPAERPEVFVCGPTSFVEAVAANLVELGHEPDRIRTERFGATGG